VSVPARAVARVDLAAIERNCARLTRGLVPGAAFGAVVKADGYGHGMVPVARAALAGGATWLFVATAAEAAGLRAAGIDRVPVQVMGAVTDDELRVAIDAGADVTAWREAFVDGLPAGARVHVKLDTGLGRLGTRDAAEATRVVEAVAGRADLTLAGLMTHFATADERGDTFFGEQLERFRAWALPLRERHPGALVHAANSPAVFRDRASHFDLVRCGVAIYGLDPFQEDAAARDLEPALTLESYVAAVKPCAAGESTGYGRRFVAREATTIATVPVGYGDGVRRSLSNNADVVIRGRRFPLVGTVSMDNITVDLGADAGGVEPGDRVTVIGEGITAEEVARRMDTINYEVPCGLTQRVPRVYDRGGEPA
jgi:alanine racemase